MNFRCCWCYGQVLQNNGVLAFISGKVLVLSMLQEHFEGSVDMVDPANSVDTLQCTNIHTELLPETVESTHTHTVLFNIHC